MDDLNQQIDLIEKNTTKYAFGFLSFGNHNLKFNDHSILDEDIILIQWNGKEWHSIFVHNDIPNLEILKKGDVPSILVNLTKQYGKLMRRVVHYVSTRKRLPKALYTLKQNFVG